MIRPDYIHQTSLLPSFIRVGTNSNTLVLVGNTFPNGFGSSFSTTVTVTSTTNRMDVYGKNSITGRKQLLSNANFPIIYQNKAGETAQMRLTYGVNNVTFTLDITNNTGSSVTLFDQTITINVVEYALPF